MAELNPPLGTTTPEIFMDNVKRADELVNGPAGTVNDRGGVPLDTWREMMAKNDEVRQNIIPLSKQYMTLEAGQADIENIPEGSTTYVRSQDGSALADEYMNVTGTLQATGRRMPSQQAVDQVNNEIEVINDTVRQVVFDGTDDIYYSVADKEGNIVGVVRRSPTGRAVVEYKNHAIADLPLDGIFLTDEDGTIKFAAYDGEVLSGTGFSQRQYTITHSDEFSFVLSDIDGNIGMAVDKKGRNLAKETTSDSQSALITHASALSAIAGVVANTFRVSNNQRPRKKLNIYIIYGQSYSVGSDSERRLSIQQYFDNLTLGTNPRGQNTGSTSPEYTFSPTGGEILFPLIESGTESPVSGLINTLKWLHNETMGVENDTGHLFAGAATGVSAVSIEQLSEGADPERYNRLRTALSGFANAAAAAGYDACVAGVIYVQGENNNNSAYDVYYAALQNLFNQINGTIKEFFPNNKDVDFFISQMGGYFVVDTNNQAIPRAQMDFCDNNPNAHFVGPYAMLPCPSSGYHLLANSYRWFYSNIAKAVHKVTQGYEHTTFRINSLRHSNNELIVGFNVPVPPLKFREAYIKQSAVMFDDKGFTVTDASGVLKGADLTVEIVAPTVIKITCSRPLTGAVRLTLADQSSHTGRHNISDSDPSVSIFKWDTNPNTSAPDYIPALNGINYPLYNWAGIDSVLSTEAK
ncbi:hypothetical protein [Raoultella planticola]|uniref:Flagellar biosynthesis, cell-distal portion of basal-body rod n=1 Tax=Raoultella planticola TaxID=575 RepID=A0ABU5M589_RAOPL|nr:hypothetical protein [Raoultella planticola]MDW4552795.1 hypothetical protein [Raoultella planticola]MDZ7446254.1 hypothetical protein [Raoultella planticola]MDZ7467091.1 hypothetical protein [Raoultella planticola]MDZ7504861.1 hypothetical protein [Raoultella planticola]MEA5394420.1 hypothetical protein [Raoultella planticola]